ncbi:MAG: DMT family transporter [Ignavibacteria bacterium]|nr:DMT family transporter [Ignavibacteria bacterium]
MYEEKINSLYGKYRIHKPNFYNEHPNLFAVVNTALAFTIWNYTLRTLTAMESSIINGTMLIQIALLAWIFLGEDISFKDIIGMLIASSGAVLVQLKFKR